MITEIKEINFDEINQKWNLWYSDNNNLNKLIFSTKKEAIFFQSGFELIKNFYNLSSLVLNKTTIEKIITLGRSSKAMMNVINRFKKEITERLSIHLSKFPFEVIINLKIELDGQND